MHPSCCPSAISPSNRGPAHTPAPSICDDLSLLSNVPNHASNDAFPSGNVRAHTFHVTLLLQVLRCVLKLPQVCGGSAVQKVSYRFECTCFLRSHFTVNRNSYYFPAFDSFSVVVFVFQFTLNIYIKWLRWWSGRRSQHIEGSIGRNPIFPQYCAIYL